VIPLDIVAHAHYWLTATLLLIGLYAMLAAPNLIRKLMGLNVFMTAVIVFYITLGAKAGGSPPVLPHHHAVARAAEYSNPLPHTLMLTAIVVGVAMTGVALALIIRIQQRFGTLDERELLRLLRE
jgi:multicomponent Na+:H+ antiporter subunit C